MKVASTVSDGRGGVVILPSTLPGLGSAIALAPDSSYKEEIGKVNGLLTAEEILDMKLNANLVVLSACNTGRGKITLFLQPVTFLDK